MVDGETVAGGAPSAPAKHAVAPRLNAIPSEKNFRFEIQIMPSVPFPTQFGHAPL
jgi:hypothetical protein